MSRDIRRVPVDFDWPLNKVWDGFLCPDELYLPACPDCQGRGSTPASEWLFRLIGRVGMLADDVVSEHPRGRDLHPWLAGDPYPPAHDVVRPVSAEERAWAQAEIDRCEARGVGAHGRLYHLVKPGSVTSTGGYVVPRPTADILELVAGLSGESVEQLGGFLGINSSTTWRMVRKVVEAAGLDPESWGSCARCAGVGDVGTAEQRAARDAWERSGPPEGDGWQLWESVSEGSPISPVFPDREGLIGWLTTEYSWGAQRTPLTREQAEAFVSLGHSIGSGVITAAGEVVSGEAAVALLGGSS